jgi:hypothetical protein
MRRDLPAENRCLHEVIDRDAGQDWWDEKTGQEASV